MMGKQAYTVKKYQVYESDNIHKIDFEDKYSAVIIPAKNGKFCVCVSCQAGCPVGCKFCHTKFFERNLSTEEIVQQVNVAQEVIGHKPTSVVFMGMGEPLLNFENVDSAIKKINQEIGVPYNRITLSTVGIKLREYKEKLFNVKYNIAISLHTASQETRDLLIPNSTTVAEIVKFVNEISAKKKHGVMMQYSLIKGVNDSDKDLENLLSLGWAQNVNFNIIEFNDCQGFKKSDRMQMFKDRIREAGYKCFIRESRGRELKSACGMLNFE